jgi:hypothetical protein
MQILLTDRFLVCPITRNHQTSSLKAIAYSERCDSEALLRSADRLSSKHYPDFLMTQASQAEDYSRPWAIIRLLPHARRFTVARFYNRQDAEDHRRLLHRFMPASEFIVLFDIPNEQLQHTTDQQKD